MCCADQASAPDSAHPRAYSTRRSNIRLEVRTRSTGVISFSTVRIGFTFSVEPLPARLCNVLGDLARTGAVAGRLGRGQHHEAEAAGGGSRVDHLDALAALAV